MKKTILTILVVAFGFVGFAQDNIVSPKQLKYVTTAPDGSIAITIYDDTRDNTIKLESANSFYKYEILDLFTREPVFLSRNNGKECTIDKTKLSPGIYNLRIYTTNFIITSKIAIDIRGNIDSSIQLADDIVASR